MSDKLNLFQKAITGHLEYMKAASNGKKGRRGLNETHFFFKKKARESIVIY
jgi:hypothetical protein